MAVEEINAAGGIKSMGGAQIKMIYADSKGDSAEGVTQTEKLITQDEVQLITGCYQSGVAMASTEVAERYQIPYFVPVPSDDQITARGMKYIFRLAEKTSWRNRDQVAFIQDMAAKTGTDRIELYTGPYAHDFAADRESTIRPYVAAAQAALDLGLDINAGHDLSLDNLPYFKQRIPQLAEVSIGHQLISDALYLGLEATIQAYQNCLR